VLARRESSALAAESSDRASFLFVGDFNPPGQDSPTWYDVLSYEIGVPAVLPGQIVAAWHGHGDDRPYIERHAVRHRRGRLTTTA
jgi:hypothetical protein